MADTSPATPPEIPANKKPQELRYVAEVFARYSKTNPGKEEKVKRGPWGIFGTRIRNDTYYMIGGSFSENAGGTLDVSTVQEALAHAGRMRESAERKLEGWLGAPQPDLIYTSGLETELWIGTAEQFEPRPSDETKIWSRRGELGAIKLSGAAITEAALESFIAKFNTPEKHLKASIAAATAPVQNVKPLKAIRLKGNAP